MIALWVALFLVLVSALAWLWLFDGARDAVSARIGAWTVQLGATAARWQSRASDGATDSSRTLRGRGGRMAGQLARHRYRILGTLLLLVAPPLLILATRQRVALEGYQGADIVRSDSQILALLRGERLVPPPELPPDVFIAAEATLLQMAQTGTAVIAPERIASADRKWDRIDPDFQQRVLAIYRIMHEQYGYEMALVEGYRSPERQAALANQGGGVTRAGAGQSCHQYGLAVDSAPIRDGKLQWDMGDPWTRRAYFRYGELAQQAGLEWGGGWRRIKDYVHLESKPACRAARRVVRAARPG